MEVMILADFVFRPGETSQLEIDSNPADWTINILALDDILTVSYTDHILTTSNYWFQLYTDSNYILFQLLFPTTDSNYWFMPSTHRSNYIFQHVPTTGGLLQDVSERSDSSASKAWSHSSHGAMSCPSRGWLGMRAQHSQTPRIDWYFTIWKGYLGCFLSIQRGMGSNNPVTLLRRQVVYLEPIKHIDWGTLFGNPNLHQPIYMMTPTGFDHCPPALVVKLGQCRWFHEPVGGDSTWFFSAAQRTRWWHGHVIAELCSHMLTHVYRILCNYCARGYATNHMLLVRFWESAAFI